MSYKKPLQKLVVFTNKSSDLENIKQDMESGWSIVSLMKNGDYYVGIMEQNNQNLANDKDTFFIPPNKKLKISSLGKVSN